MARLKAVRADSMWAALGGALTGYVLWLIAISIGEYFTTAGQWGPIVLAASAVSALIAMLWRRRLLAAGNVTLAAFAVGLPVLPVLLSALVVVWCYL
jgi:hypothetical protein